MSIKYIAINGPSGSGRSTIARELCSRLKMPDAPPRAVMDSLAAPLKHYIATLLGDRYNDMDKRRPRAELFGYSVSDFIQFEAGVASARYGDDVFAKSLVHRCLRLLPLPRFVIVDDLTTEAEYLVLNGQPGGVRMIHVRGRGDKNRESDYVHFSSETVFWNDGEMATLWARVDRLAGQILRSRYDQ